MVGSCHRGGVFLSYLRADWHGQIPTGTKLYRTYTVNLHRGGVLSYLWADPHGQIPTGTKLYRMYTVNLHGGGDPSNLGANQHDQLSAGTKLYRTYTVNLYRGGVFLSYISATSQLTDMAKYQQVQNCTERTLWTFREEGSSSGTSELSWLIWPDISRYKTVQNIHCETSQRRGLPQLPQSWLSWPDTSRYQTVLNVYCEPLQRRGPWLPLSCITWPDTRARAVRPSSLLSM
jgi:hypothetical protein